MKKFFLASFLYSITICGINAAQIAQRQVEGKIMLNPIAFQRPDLYNSGNIDKGLLFGLLRISDKALNEASKRKIITTQESLDRSYLEMPIPPKIKFLGEPDERERMTQIVNAIIERFNSESLGFSAVADSPFFNRPLAKVRNQDRRCSDLHKGRRLSEPQIIDTGDDIESEVELFSEISVR